MWACRSFLRRHNHLITSRPRSVSRHHPTHTALPCPNLVSASRRHVSDATNVDRHQPAAAAAKKKHLYVVLDDHKKDYGIYKLDADADLRDGDVNTDSTTAPRLLPHPAHIRMEVTEDDSATQFAATGSCIVSTSCSPYSSLIHSGDCGVVTILYDIKTAALSISTHPTDTLHWGYAVAVPVGNRLYVLDLRTSSVDSFHVMTTSKDAEAAADVEVKQRDPGWYDGSGSSRIGWSYGGKARSWSELLPFDSDDIKGYAVHPQDCTIFLSAPVLGEEWSGANWRCPVNTFAYDTTTAGCWKWTRYGRWELPFKGHARYDRQLNKWVGLHVGEDGDGTTGYICACDVPSSDHDENRPLQWVRSMEKIVLDDPNQRRLDLKLVYMGERAEYCLFERLRCHGANEKECAVVDGEECVLRLTTFRLEYECDDPGYLRIMDRHARSYKVLRYRDDFEAQAFWL
ncbi:hypothetical protein ACQ4PT_002136 [Festuca glaucescens]